VIASIVSILDISCKLMQYANSVRKASRERIQVASEASTIYILLIQLQSRIDQSQTADPWFKEAQSLAIKGGVLDQLRSILEILAAKISPDGRMKDLAWNVTSSEVQQALTQIEHLKSSISIALQQDHLWAS
jgi:hypothetical protein